MLFLCSCSEQIFENYGIFEHFYKIHNLCLCLTCFKEFSDPSIFAIHLEREHNSPEYQYTPEIYLNILICCTCHKFFSGDKFFNSHDCIESEAPDPSQAEVDVATTISGSSNSSQYFAKNVAIPESGGNSFQPVTKHSTNFKTDDSQIVTEYSTKFKSNDSQIVTAHSIKVDSNDPQFVREHCSNFESDDSQLVIENSTKFESNDSQIVTEHCSNFESDDPQFVREHSTDFESDDSQFVTEHSIKFESNDSQFVIEHCSNAESDDSQLVTENSTKFESNDSQIVTEHSTNFESNDSQIVKEHCSNFECDDPQFVREHSTNFESDDSQLVTEHSTKFESNDSQFGTEHCSNVESDDSQLVTEHSTKFESNDSQIGTEHSTKFESNDSQIVTEHCSNFESDDPQFVKEHSTNFESDDSQLVSEHSTKFESNDSQIVTEHSSNFESNDSQILTKHSTKFESNSQLVTEHSTKFESNDFQIMTKYSTNFVSDDSQFVTELSNNFESNDFQLMTKNFAISESDSSQLETGNSAFFQNASPRRTIEQPATSESNNSQLVNENSISIFECNSSQHVTDNSAITEKDSFPSVKESYFSISASSSSKNMSENSISSGDSSQLIKNSVFIAEHKYSKCMSKNSASFQSNSSQLVKENFLSISEGDSSQLVKEDLNSESNSSQHMIENSTEKRISQVVPENSASSHHVGGKCMKLLSNRLKPKKSDSGIRGQKGSSSLDYQAKFMNTVKFRLKLLKFPQRKYRSKSKFSSLRRKMPKRKMMYKRKKSSEDKTKIASIPMVKGVIVDDVQDPGQSSKSFFCSMSKMTNMHDKTESEEHSVMSDEHAYSENSLPSNTEQRELCNDEDLLERFLQLNLNSFPDTNSHHMLPGNIQEEAAAGSSNLCKKYGSMKDSTDGTKICNSVLIKSNNDVLVADNGLSSEHDSGENCQDKFYTENALKCNSSEYCINDNNETFTTHFNFTTGTAYSEKNDRYLDTDSYNKTLKENVSREVNNFDEHKANICPDTSSERITNSSQLLSVSCGERFYISSEKQCHKEKRPSDIKDITADLKTTGKEEKNNKTSLELEEDIEIAGDDVQVLVIPLRDNDALSIETLIKECLKESSAICTYCKHATRIAVNEQQLVKHLLTKHKFQPVAYIYRGELSSTDGFVEKLRSSLPGLEDLYFDLNGDGRESISGMYECLHCNFIALSYRTLNDHCRQVHRRALLQCILCMCEFKRYSELLCHFCPAKRTDGISMKFRCCFCTMRNVRSSFRLMVHLRRSHNTCDMCFEKCSSQGELLKHTIKHKTVYLCYPCGIAYQKTSDFKKHLYWKHGTESKQCMKCLQQKWPHAYHFCTPPNEFVCSQCNSRFSRPSQLIVHERLHRLNLPHKCETCKRQFVSKKSLQRHQQRQHKKNSVKRESPKSSTAFMNSNQNTHIDVTKETLKGNNQLANECEKQVNNYLSQWVDNYNVPPLNLSSSSDESDIDASTKMPVSSEKYPIGSDSGKHSREQRQDQVLPSLCEIPCENPVSKTSITTDHDYCRAAGKSAPTSLSHNELVKHNNNDSLTNDETSSDESTSGSSSSSQCSQGSACSQKHSCSSCKSISDVQQDFQEKNLPKKENTTHIPVSKGKVLTRKRKANRKGVSRKWKKTQKIVPKYCANILSSQSPIQDSDLDTSETESVESFYDSCNENQTFKVANNSGEHNGLRIKIQIKQQYVSKSWKSSENSMKYPVYPPNSTSSISPMRSPELQASSSGLVSSSGQSSEVCDEGLNSGIVNNNILHSYPKDKTYLKHNQKPFEDVSPTRESHVPVSSEEGCARTCLEYDAHTKQTNCQRKQNLYCFCQCPYDEVSEMIACDGKKCAIEWFHFECVGILEAPNGKWLCPNCCKDPTNYEDVM